MIEVLQSYGMIIVEFLAELLLFSGMILIRLRRRRGFWYRLPLSLVVLFGVGLPVAWFYSAFGGNVFGRIAVYLVLFTLFTLLAAWCFEAPFFTVLFCCTLAYAAQNLAYKIFLIFWTAGEAFRLFDGWGRHFSLFYRLVYYSFFLACAAGEYFLLLRRVGKRLSACVLDSRMLLFTVAALAVTVILCSFEDVYFAHLSVERENRFLSSELVVLREAGNAFSAVCCSIVFLLSYKTLEERELSREVDYLKHAIRQSERQYHISKDTIDLINVKCHDIRYRLGVLASEVPVLEDIRRDVAIYDSRIETGSPLLNVLLTEKSLYCEQNNINISCMIDGGKLNFIEEGDLYCLFGNLIDNALEAVKKITEPSRRVIDLVVKQKDSMLLVQEENYFDGELEFSDGLPVTTKGDREHHGFGMRSLRLIARKYGGELSAYVKGDVFHLNIIFGNRQSV